MLHDFIRAVIRAKNRAGRKMSKIGHICGATRQYFGEIRAFAVDLCLSRVPHKQQDRILGCTGLPMPLFVVVSLFAGLVFFA
jgi:hypothetical protein